MVAGVRRVYCRAMVNRTNLGRIAPLQRLAVFDAAARLGSFTAAATELGMTQPAVTRQIRQLERNLGADLFVRGPNSSSLSEIGRRLHDHVATGLDVLEAGLAELAENAATLVLAVTPGIAQQLLFPRLDGLIEELGDVELRLTIVDRDRDLIEGGFDAAIWLGTGAFTGFRSHLLFDEVVFPVASPSLAAEHGLDRNSSAAEVKEAPLIHMDDGGRPWMNWSRWLAAFGLALSRRPGRVLFNNYPLVLQQALAGKGVALGWAGVVDALLASEGLTVVGPEVRTERSYYLLRPDGRPSDAVSNLVRWVDRELGVLQARDPGPRRGSDASGGGGDR